MRTLQLRRAALDEIEREARHTYPEEACGFLFSPPESLDRPTRSVTTTEVAANSYAGERGRRFVITPEELSAAERRAERRGELVSGFYHSHPDHPALPSTFDTEHAWPWYAYLVVSVDRRGACSAGVFELDDEHGRFAARELDVVADLPEVAAPRSGLRTEA